MMRTLKFMFFLRTLTISSSDNLERFTNVSVTVGNQEGIRGVPKFDRWLCGNPTLLQPQGPRRMLGTHNRDHDKRLPSIFQLGTGAG